jgi:hypothetical protein
MTGAGTSRTVETTAAGKVMRLGELRAFLHALDSLGAADDTRIEGRVTMKGGIKSLRATAGHAAAGVVAERS